MTALDFLSIHDFGIDVEYDQMANAMEDLVKGELSSIDFADLLYSYWEAQKES